MTPAQIERVVIWLLALCFLFAMSVAVVYTVLWVLQLLGLRHV